MIVREEVEMQLLQKCAILTGQKPLKFCSSPWQMNIKLYSSPFTELQFPIKKLVWIIHNNTNSTDFSNFLSNINLVY